MAVKNKKQVLMYGNDAIAEAAIRAGCVGYFGYPITPQNELIGYMAKHLPAHGRTFIQAESEIAAINMVYGAAAAGGRVMTSSSSPGISLKQEGISYLVGAELPCVIVNIVRGGPGLGNIAPAQSDYYQATRGGGHGDYRTIVLAPHSVQEAVDLTVLSFDLAEKYRNPVIILGDGIIGQMKEPVALPAHAKTSKKNDFGWSVGPNPRNRDRRAITSIYLDEGALERHNLALDAKYKKISKSEVRSEEVGTRNADVIIVAYGTSARVSLGAVRMAQAAGYRVGLIRPITLWPFPEKRIKALAKNCGTFLAVEMSMGQMVDDVRLAINGAAEVHLHSRTGGGVPTSEDVFRHIKRLVKKNKIQKHK